MRPITADDEHRMLGMQARADDAYRAANRRAPPPLPLENPDQYRLRLADGLKVYSPKWRNVDLRNVADAGALDVAETQVFADAIANGRTHGLKPYEIRERVTTGHGGHKVIEFDGGPDASFVRQFSREPRLGIFKSHAEYAAMSRDAQLSRIGAIVHEYRPAMAAPRSSF
jgi:hypothetical protein